MPPPGEGGVVPPLPGGPPPGGARPGPAQCPRVNPPQSSSDVQLPNPGTTPRRGSLWFCAV
eukprot:5723549-Prymnesium_polylepis.1